MKGRLAIGGLVAALALAGTAYGARTDLGSDVSANWAGYVITGAYTSYTSVTGTWKQPQITCTASDGGASSAFWVGLGGYYTSSQSLEQIGTSADCNASLTARLSTSTISGRVPAGANKANNTSVGKPSIPNSFIVGM